jgi:tRNA C32,U32 (ribose-2'-O)-methylase TrmJ
VLCQIIIIFYYFIQITFSQIEEYLTIIDTRTKQQEELKNKKKEEKERIYQHIVEKMNSLDEVSYARRKSMKYKCSCFVNLF